MNVLDAVKAFIHIAEAGSISKAADRCYTTQATMSRKLKKLEEHLDSELITRSTRSFVLTEAGESFLVDARNLVAHWHHTQDKYREVHHGLSRALKVIVPLELGQTLMASWAVEFQRKHSGVLIDLTAQKEPDRRSRIHQDVWIRLAGGDDPAPEMENRPLAVIRQVVVSTPELISQEKVNGVASIERMPFICAKSNQQDGIELSSATSHRSFTIYPTPAMVSDNSLSMYLAIKQGAGFGILPYWMIKDELEAGTLIEVLPGWQTSSSRIHAIYRKSDDRLASIERFLDYISYKLVRTAGIRVTAGPRLVSIA